MRRRRSSGCQTGRHRIACSAGTPVEVDDLIVSDGVHPVPRGQVLLEPIGVQDARNRPGIGRLHARHDPLNVIPLVGGAAGVTLISAAGLLHHRQDPTDLRRHASCCEPDPRSTASRSPAVAADASKDLHRMRGADFAHVAVAREAVLRLRRQAWDEHHRFGLSQLDPPRGCGRAEEHDRAESKQGRAHSSCSQAAPAVSRPMMPARITSKENLRHTIGSRKPSAELARTGGRQEIGHQGEHGQDHARHASPPGEKDRPTSAFVAPTGRTTARVLRPQRRRGSALAAAMGAGRTRGEDQECSGSEHRGEDFAPHEFVAGDACVIQCAEPVGEPQCRHPGERGIGARRSGLTNSSASPNMCQA